MKLFDFTSYMYRKRNKTGHDLPSCLEHDWISLGCWLLCVIRDEFGSQAI